MRQSEDAFKKNVKKKPQTHNGNITGSGERELVPKAGLYQRGLLKSLMTWAIPTPTAEYILKPVCCSLFQLLGFCRHLLVRRRTPINTRQIGKAEKG
jgi:hypothetical protein